MQHNPNLQDADDETRLAAARRLSKSLLSTARSSGVVAFTSRAVAVWMVPGAPSVLTALGWTDALAFSGFERRGRLAVLAEAIEGRLARLTASWRGRYYQLEALGTAGEASVEAVTPVVRPVFDRVSLHCSSYRKQVIYLLQRHIKTMCVAHGLNN